MPRRRKPTARKPTRKPAGRLPADLWDRSNPLAATGKPRTPSTRPAPSGRRVTRAGALGPRDYTAGGRPPAADLGDAPPVRLTAYLRPDQVARLRAEAARRFAEGRRSDVSMLLREAVEAVFPPPARARRRRGA